MPPLSHLALKAWKIPGKLLAFSSHCKAKDGYSEARREGPESKQGHFPLGLYIWAKVRRCCPL